MAALINEINHRESRHIVIIEDPIEYEHTHVRSVVEQIEIGTDAPDFPTALRAALRKPPTLEARMRLERLLEKLEGVELTAEELQAVRAVEVLERIGTAEARKVLDTLTRQEISGVLSREAKGALDRLGRKKNRG